MPEHVDMPRLGFGTYGRTGDAGVAAMLDALEVGYRHLDTAQDYGTEGNVGAAIRRSGLDRRAVFVTTKVATGNLGPGALVPSVERSLDALGLDRVDLTLIHWPSPNGSVPLPVYVEQLAAAKARGLTRAIGVSNFPIALLEQTRELLGPGEILTNQIELNPLFQNRRLAEFCRGEGILVTCYQPIAKGRVGEVPVLRRIAGARGATPEQVALAFELAKGYAAIPTSGSRERIRLNHAAASLSLTPDEIAEIEALPQGPRRIDPAWGPAWD